MIFYFSVHNYLRTFFLLQIRANFEPVMRVHLILAFPTAVFHTFLIFDLGDPFRVHLRCWRREI